MLGLEDDIKYTKSKTSDKTTAFRVGVIGTPPGPSWSHFGNLVKYKTNFVTPEPNWCNFR
jgi:hypothetical protein